MKVWETLHKGIIYRFEYFESTGEITVSKHNKLTYTIIFIPRNNSWFCDCPSGSYRGYCWHKDEISLVLSQPNVAGSWAEWAEEASQMRCEGR